MYYNSNKTFFKVVCALAAGQPIVTPAYWKVFSQAFNSIQTTFPDCKGYLPPLAETVLDPSKISFHPNPARAKLFSGITFVAVTTKQMSRIKPMVEAAGRLFPKSFKTFSVQTNKASSSRYV